jgi:peptidyl-prolyl cis-trans isomerase D
MSVLESLRKRSGLLVAIVGLALFAFVLTGLFQNDSSLFSGDESVVGEIAGKSIDIKDFRTKVDEAIENQKRNSNKVTLEQNEIDGIVQQIWNQTINEEVLNKEYAKLGIAVSDEELYDLMVDHPHAALVRNLSDPQTGKIAPMFADDKTGEVSPEKIRKFTASMNDEQEKQWAQLENYIRQIRTVEKYNNMVKKGLYVTKAVAKTNFIAQNTNSDIKYVVKSYNTIVDSTLKPTDAELSNYYKAHQNEFKQETSRKIEYVAFNITASPEDIEETRKEMQKIAEEFKTKKTGEDSTFVISQATSRNFDISYHTKGTLSPEIDTTMFNSEIGTVVGPYTENGSFVISKLIAIKNSADSAKVRHILISYQGAGASPDVTRTKERAKIEADSLLTVLKKERNKFGEFVEKYSDDNGKKMPPNKKEGEDYPGKGGDYGWMNANSGFVEPFKNAGLDGKKGDLVVVETQFGYHIIEVLDAKGSQKKVQVASIDRKIEPSTKTRQNLFVQASEFAGKNTTEELFQSAVVAEKLNKRIADNIKENDRNIPGIDSPRDLIRWVYENKKGTVSEPKEFGDKFIVAVITEVREEGIAPMDQVKEDLTAKVIKEKKGEKLAKELADGLAGNTTIDALASKLNIPLQQAQGINFSTNALPGSSNEPEVIGIVTAQKAQTISKPIVGKEGVFVVYVNAKTEAPAQKDFNEQQKGAMVEMQGRVDSEVYDALKKNANIKEHFVKFGL